MALPSPQFIAALVRWGSQSDENKALLVTWQSAAIQSIAEGNGGQVASGSANGVAFTQAMGATTMTNQEWFTALDMVLQHIEAGTLPSTRTIARLC